MPCRHDPIVNPPDIEDTTHGLQKIKRKKGELSRNINEPSEGGLKTYYADHVDVSRSLE